MSTIMIGSARIDERGKASGGQAGDQKQTSSSNDTKGEVSLQPMYSHSKGWLVFRPIRVSHANVMAAKMTSACNNRHIGYDQGNRLGIITKGISTKTDTECDCSTLVREDIKESTGIDPGNFTTENEAEALKKTGLFEDPFEYKSQKETPVCNGDVLVTKTKGHTAIVTSGNPRQDKACYAAYKGKSSSIVAALAAVGETDTSKAHRKKIAAANGIAAYTGSAAQNAQLLILLKAGRLIKYL